MATQPSPGFRKTTETYIPGAKSLPQRYLLSPEIFAKEQERIFSTQWLCVGHQSQIQKAGGYFLQQAAGESLVILRDATGADIEYAVERVAAVAADLRATRVRL